MREIKFRAWYLAGEMIGELRGFEYYEDQEEKIDIWKPMIRVFEKDGDEISYPAGAIILMQFIGLHDKKGKEIFEGDIVRLNGRFVDEVTFEASQFCTRNPQATNVLSEWGKIEVIGNIYESQELLKGEGAV